MTHPSPSSPESGDASLPPGAEDRSISLADATLRMLLPAVTLLLPLITAHWARWGAGSIQAALRAFFEPLYISMPLLFGAIAAHEAIHAAAWAFFGGRPWSDFRFGVQWRTMTPYAHCLTAMPARAYRLGAAAPGVILGVLPALVGTVLGWPGMAGFGWMMSFAAAGDLLVLQMLRGVPPGRPVRDHPTRAGCVVFRQASA